MIYWYNCFQEISKKKSIEEKADGVSINNTYLLEKKYDWSGICVEANPILFDKLKETRNCLLVNSCVDESAGEVKFCLKGLYGYILDENIVDRETGNSFSQTEEEIKTISTFTLKQILDQNNAPKIIDYLSIDVEGAETRILRYFPFDEYTFLSMTIERPDEELQKLLTNKGYTLVKMIPNLDYFYIHKSYLQKYNQNVRKFYAL